MDEAARVVASALVETDEWSKFHEAVQRLDEQGKADLRAARQRLSVLLAPEAIDAHEPGIVLRRDDYRIQATREVIESLEGSARSYADAFEAVNDLIDLATSDVFGQLAMYGLPEALTITQLDLRGDSPAMVDFEVRDEGPWLVECGDLVWLSDPLVVDAVWITSISMNFNPAEGGLIRAGGRILDNSAEAWRQNSGHDTGDL